MMQRNKGTNKEYISKEGLPSLEGTFAKRLRKRTNLLHAYLLYNGQRFLNAGNVYALESWLKDLAEEEEFEGIDHEKKQELIEEEMELIAQLLLTDPDELKEPKKEVSGEELEEMQDLIERSAGYELLEGEDREGFIDEMREKVGVDVDLVDVFVADKVKRRKELDQRLKG